MESFHRNAATKRRPSHQSSEHELEEQINEWANMTGFLCALGGVCLQRRASGRTLTTSLSLNPDAKKTSKQHDMNSAQEVQYCPVTQFVYNLLRLLICNNEKFGPLIQRHVKDLMGHEMSPALYPILFDQIKSIVDKFFDQQGQVIVNEVNTQFIDHIILIMKNVLDCRADQPSEYLGMTSIEGMILAIVRYVRHLDMTHHSIRIKTKLCQLVEVMMKRRDDLAFRQEMKFRNKLVEYLTDWVMGTSHQIVPPSAGEVSILTKYPAHSTESHSIISLQTLTQLFFPTVYTRATWTKRAWRRLGPCCGDCHCSRRNRTGAI